MEHAIQNMQRRQSRQMALEEALRMGVLEASRRHSMHPNSRKAIILPPINSSLMRAERRQTVNGRSRAKSIAVLAMHGNITKDFARNDDGAKIPLKLPKINGRRTSVVNEVGHWQLPARRVSRENDKIIVEHLRRRLLKQHERRVSLAFEEQSKAIEEEERSLNSRESYDEEAIRSLRSNHSRTHSYSTLNFSSTATSRVGVYQDNTESISRRPSEISLAADATSQEIKQPDENKPPSPTPPPKPRPKPPLTSRPSICISSDTGFTDWIDVDGSDERKAKDPTSADDAPPTLGDSQSSVFQQSWNESERSVTMLMQLARRRSQLTEIPEVKSQSGIVTQQSTVAVLSGQGPVCLLKDPPTSVKKINEQRKASEQDQEVPIGEVTLFSDWLSPGGNSPAQSRRGSFMSDVTTLPDDVTNPTLSRQNTSFTERSVTPLPPNPVPTQIHPKPDSPSPPASLSPEELRNLLLRIYHGDVTDHVPYVKRKVCIYVSSAGLDTALERNVIHDSLTSRLRHFCGERGVAFELIDINSFPMEWCASPLEADVSRVFVDSGHSLPQLRRDLVEKARREGIGTTFMCFLSGGRTQKPTIPEILEPRVFDVIMGVIDDEINDIEMTILQLKRSNVTGSIESPDEKSKSASSSVTSEALKNSNVTGASSSVQSYRGESDETAANPVNVEGHVTALREKLRRVQEKKNVLLRWYWMDENSKPPIYRLKSIKSQYKTYAGAPLTNQRPDNEKIRREEQLWTQVKSRIRSILHHYSDPELLPEQKSEDKEVVVCWTKSSSTPTIVAESRLALSRGVASTCESCFWFHRHIDDVKEHRADEDSKTFLPINPGTNSVDQQHLMAIERFKADLLEEVGYTNHRDYPLTWNQVKQAYTSRGVGDVTNDDVRAWNMYLDRLRLDFYNVCTMQIGNALEKMEMNLEDRDFAAEEALDHVRFARDLAVNFRGREETLKVIRGYLRSTRNRKPLVVFGECGAGKSSVLSRVMTSVNSWMTSSSNKQDVPTCRVIFRSVGVTGGSKKPRTLLSGICSQLRHIVEDVESQPLPPGGANGQSAQKHKPLRAKTKDLDFRSLSVRFANLLKKFATKQQLLCLFIDNLDGISNEHDARKLNWIPERLPKFVKLVVSINGRLPLNSSDVDANSDCFEALRARCVAECDDGELPGNFVYVPPLAVKSAPAQSLESLITGSTNDTIEDVLNAEMGKYSRTVTAKQGNLVTEKCRRCALPLAVATCAFTATKWSSVERVDVCESQLPSKGETIEEFVHCMFRNLEESHGRALVAACACFLTSSLHGLTSFDMLCLLSADRNVGQWLGAVLDRSKVPDVAKRRPVGQKPPPGKAPKTKNTAGAKGGAQMDVGLVKRLPDLLWQSLLADLQFCLLESSADHVITYKWKHVIYSRISTIRYMSQPESQAYYHRIMATYFSGQGMDKASGDHKHDTCQPLHWHVKHADAKHVSPNDKPATKDAYPSSEAIYNLRRLNESFHHYLKSRSLSAIRDDLLCNYEWLLAKMRGVSFEALMEDISAALALHPCDNDLRLLAECLHLSRVVLKSDPAQLAAQLVGRLYLILKKDKPLARMDPRKYPSCRMLIGQCRRSSLPVLVPSGTCLTTPGDILYDLHQGHRDVITAVTMTTDGQRAISTSRDQTLKVWDLYSRRVVTTFTGVSRHVTSLAVCMSNNYVIIVIGHSKVEVRCLRTFLCLLSLTDAGERVVTCVAGDGMSLLVVACHTARVLKIWDLEKVRMLHKIDISPDHVTLRDDQSPLLARSSRSNNILVSYHSSDEAYVYNVRRPKHLNTMKLQESHGEYALITHVEVSREYYVIACKRQYMRLHEMVTFELYDAINFGHVRTIRACPEDSIIDVFVNRLGSHVIALCRGSLGSEIGVWNVETGKHQHMACQSFHSSAGCCLDLQYCVTIGDDDTSMRVHNLAARIDDKTLSRTQVKKESVGIGEFYPLTSNSKYVVARGMDNGPITVWNITRGRCKGEAVSIERGLLEKNDVVVVKDVQVVILSDRGISLKDSSRHVFKTIFVYDLRTKKYSKKLHPVEITICPPKEYHVLGADRLLAVSHDRSHFVIWSLISGMVLSHIPLDFSKYVIAENEARENDKRQKRKRHTKSKSVREKTTKTGPKHSHSGGSPCHLTEDERSRLIDQAMLSEDESTLLCSFYGRHVAVIDVEEMRHVATLTSKNSMLLLHQAKMTPRGCHLVHTNYDDVTKTSYLSVWNLRQGCVIRRLKNEPLVCGLAVCDNASRIVFATEDNFIKIWEPFKKGSHRRIPGYEGLRMRRSEGKYPRTSVFLAKSATRAILFAHDISLWDLEKECVISKFTPDIPFSCCTVAMNGRLIVAGLRDVPQVVTLRLMSRDLDARQYGRSALGGAAESSMFGEREERDSESSGDELLDDE